MLSPGSSQPLEQLLPPQAGWCQGPFGEAFPWLQLEKSSLEVAEGVLKALPFLFPPSLVAASNPGLGLLSHFGFCGFFLLKHCPAQLCPAKAPQGAAPFLSLPCHGNGN